MAAAADDRVGLGWRPELAAGIVTHLDAIDLIEVIADDHLAGRRRDLDALRTLSAQVPVLLHGVGLGLASARPVDGARLDRLAALVDAVRPSSWSEHLAFVRAGAIEIGHLAAPPRTEATIAGACANLRRAHQVVGTRPLVENVATLIDPPGSTLDEATWLDVISREAGCELLLDLHNLHANAVNFGFDAVDALARLPLDRVGQIHVAGGRWVDSELVPGARRLLDDHLHAVPGAVYVLLEELAAITPRPLTVILERDGAYPPIEELLAELAATRAALARGRARRSPGTRP